MIREKKKILSRIEIFKFFVSDHLNWFRYTLIITLQCYYWIIFYCLLVVMAEERDQGRFSRNPGICTE